MSADPSKSNEKPSEPSDFIRSRVRHDVDTGVVADRVTTRFPPEPNGYLHIGHAKSICLNFGVAQEFGGVCYLRFDDTNPLKEDEEYVESIQADVRWLGFDWGDRLTYASDYFEQLFDFAVQLINDGKAYVCSLSADQIRETRGTLTEPGRDSPYRDRSVAESLDLFQRMRAGEFPDGAHVLRARIDMASPNVNMRDPVLYRIRHTSHQRTGDTWCIYPTYDYTHCICDALEGITHSLCTLEFEDHRPLYDWVLDNINVNFHPPQIEFSRLGLEYTVMSKRLLHQLVDEKHVAGLGRSADADDRRVAPPRRHARGDPRLLQPHRCHEAGQHHRDKPARVLYAAGPRSNRAARHGACSTAQGHDHELPERCATRSCRRRGIPNAPTWARASCTFGQTIYIERDDFAKVPPPKTSNASCRWDGAVAARLTSSAATTSSKTRPALSSSCVAATCRNRRAAPTPAA